MLLSAQADGDNKDTCVFLCACIGHDGAGMFAEKML